MKAHHHTQQRSCSVATTQTGDGCCNMLNNSRRLRGALVGTRDGGAHHLSSVSYQLMIGRRVRRGEGHMAFLLAAASAWASRPECSRCARACLHMMLHLSLGGALPGMACVDRLLPCRRTCPVCCRGCCCWGCCCCCCCRLRASASRRFSSSAASSCGPHPPICSCSNAEGHLLPFQSRHSLSFMLLCFCPVDLAVL